MDYTWIERSKLQLFSETWLEGLWETQEITELIEVFNCVQ